MKELTQIWIQDTSQTSAIYPGTFTVYDGGDFMGFLFEQQNKPTTWHGYTVLSRRRTGDGIEISLQETHEFVVPKEFFAVDTYPFRQEGLTLWIPGWKILQKLQQPQQQPSEQPRESGASDSPLSQVHPLGLPRLLPQARPSQQPRPLSSQSPRKLPSVKPKQLPPPSQNKNNTATTQKV